MASEIAPVIASDVLDLPKLQDYKYWTDGRVEGIRFYFANNYVLSIVRNVDVNNRYVYAGEDTYEIAVWPGNEETEEKGYDYPMTPMFFESQDQYDVVRGWSSQEYIYRVAERISQFNANALPA